MDCSILVVDNTPQLLVTLSEVLEGKGCSVTRVVDGKAALHAVEENSYHLIVADLKLSQVNGCNILQKAKSLRPETMVVLFTGSYDLNLSLSSYLLDADDYLVKTCDKEELSLRMTNILQRLVHHRTNGHAEERARSLNDQILNMLMLVSHDLRSPLVSVNATLKLLLRGVYGNMDSSVRNTLVDLSGRVNKLLGVAEDSLSKASELKDEVNGQRDIIDLRQDIIDPVLEELAPELEANSISIDNRLGAIPGNQIALKADKVWMKIVFRNLFRNAIKYGGKGSTIAFGFEEYGTSYRLNVYNSGPSIPVERRGRLFTKFCRINNDDRTDGDGLGMGLYLVKNVIQKHGGDIWYEAKEDGSNFVFTLPSY